MKEIDFYGVDPFLFLESKKGITENIMKLEKVVEEKFAKNKNESLISTNQIRLLYDKVKNSNTTQLQLLYPKVIYMAARQKEERGKQIIIQISKIIKLINSDEELNSFKKFMEAIVAFQKYYFPTNN